MQNLEIANSPLKSINPNDYTISIRPRPGGFCFALYDRLSRKVTALYDVAANSVDNLVQKWEGLGLKGEYFNNIFILEDSEKWTLVPDAIKGADLNAIWQLNFGQKPTKELKGSSIPQIGAKCIFDVSEKCRQLQERFPNSTLYPIQVPDIFHTIQKSQIDNCDCLGLNVRSKQLDLYMASKGKLLLANAFTYETSSDILYFTMNAVRIFQLDQQLVNVDLWGRLPEGTTDLLKQYISNVAVAEPNNQNEYANGIKKLTNKHEYYDLFNIATCAL